MNKSLATLKSCLAARGHASARMPLRDASLTRVLGDALEGIGKLVLIGTVSPSSSDTEHALDTLNHVAVRLGHEGEASGLPCGSRVLTRKVAGEASLDRGEAGGGEAGGGGAAEDRPRPADPRAWSSDEVVDWWIEAAAAAAAAVNAELDAAAAAGGGPPAPPPGFTIVCSGAQWPPKTKLGLSFEAAAESADADAAPPVLSKVTPRTPLAQANAQIRAGCALVGAGLMAAGDGAEGVERAEGAEGAEGSGRAAILGALKHGSSALVAAANELDAAHTEAKRAYEKVRPPLNDSTRLIRECVFPSPRPPDSPPTHAPAPCPPSRGVTRAWPAIDPAAHSATRLDACGETHSDKALNSERLVPAGMCWAARSGRTWRGCSTTRQRARRRRRRRRPSRRSKRPRRRRRRGRGRRRRGRRRRRRTSASGPRPSPPRSSRPRRPVLWRRAAAACASRFTSSLRG